jgi:hypothetical protein
MAKVIQVDGTTYEMENPTLEKLQLVVGGYIEALNLGNGKYLVVNEEGLMQRLAINPSASRLWGRGPIVGHVVICTNKELN